MIRRFGNLLLLLAVAAGAQAAPGPVQVPVTSDLASDGRTAAQRQLPILLVFSADHCSYCELLEREILKPMLRSGDYADRVLIRKVMLDSSGNLRDFSGETVDAGSFATFRDVYVTPTMLFLDPQGRELAPRLVGINTVEMFGGLVDAAIEQARTKLKAQTGAEPLARLELRPPRP